MAMIKFQRSCERSEEYPKNLIATDTPLYSIQTIGTQVDQRANELFCEEGVSHVDILELVKHSNDPRKVVKSTPRSAKSLDQLRTHLNDANGRPLARFICIHARHSRDRLRISRRMFNLLLTNYQVPPAFMEYVFPFGKQHFAQDFHSSGFRNTSRFREDEVSLKIDQLMLSGRLIEIFYSLKSVEYDPHDGVRPWYVRQCSVYHCFDVKYERATWITIKGNQLAKRFAESFLDNKVEDASRTQSALGNTLEVHELFCGWSTGNWQWYINFVEKKFQDVTRRALAIPVVGAARITRSKQSWEKARPGPVGFSRVMALFAAVAKRLSFVFDPSASGNTTSTPNPLLGAAVGKQSPKETKVTEASQPPFSFEELQDVQYIEEKAAEASLILKTNASVLSQVRRTYAPLCEHADLVDLAKEDWKVAVRRFLKHLDDMISSLEMQQSRADTLLRLVGERKSLLYGILQYQNMEANRELAEKAELTAVSVKIITLVTLFFLPGTFISTLMSTPIVTFEPGTSYFTKQNIGAGALQLYAVVSLPLLMLTLIAWWGVYLWERRSNERRRAKLTGSARSMA